MDLESELLNARRDVESLRQHTRDQQAHVEAAQRVHLQHQLELTSLEAQHGTANSAVQRLEEENGLRFLLAWDLLKSASRADQQRAKIAELEAKLKDVHGLLQARHTSVGSIQVQRILRTHVDSGIQTERGERIP